MERERKRRKKDEINVRDEKGEADRWHVQE